MEDQIFGFNMPETPTKASSTSDTMKLAREILGIEGECAPYPWCRGNPTVKDCIRLGYCARDPNCGE
jgi:hypothetical protein